MFIDSGARTLMVVSGSTFFSIDSICSDYLVSTFPNFFGDRDDYGSRQKRLQSNLPKWWTPPPPPKKKNY